MWYVLLIAWTGKTHEGERDSFVWLYVETRDPFRGESGRSEVCSTKLGNVEAGFA